MSRAAGRRRRGGTGGAKAGAGPVHVLLLYAMLPQELSLHADALVDVCPGRQGGRGGGTRDAKTGGPGAVHVLPLYAMLTWELFMVASMHAC